LYVDLVFYNHLLKCFVLFDLKSGEVAHQDFGHTDMYVRMMNELKRAPDDNPTVGIILCNYRDSSIVRYSVLHENEQIFASRYKMVLPSEEELRAELEREGNHLATPTEQNGGMMLLRFVTQCVLNPPMETSVWPSPIK